MLYVYGVVRAGHPAPDRSGLGEQPVRAIESGPVAALVSDLPAGHDLDEEDARAQLHVLIDALRAGPVVPMRLGTLVDDEDTVRRDVLDPGAADLADTLQALDGLVELELDADDDESQVITAVAGTGPPLAAPGADLATQIEIGQQVAARVIEHRQAVAGEIVERLRKVAVDDVPRSVLAGPEDPVLRWAFLVRAEDVDRFDQAVIELRTEHPELRFRYVGPVPPAHFADRRTQPAESAADTFRGSGTWGW